MPIYEYTCKQCRHPFETLVMNSTEVVGCPGCGSERVEKRFSVFGVGASTSGSESGSGPCGMPDPGGCSPSGCAMPGCPQPN